MRKLSMSDLLNWPGKNKFIIQRFIQRGEGKSGKGKKKHIDGNNNGM